MQEATDNQLWYYPDIARFLNKSVDATRQLARRKQLLPPDGKVGRSPYWLPNRVKSAYSNNGGSKRQGGRPRNQPVV